LKWQIYYAKNPWGETRADYRQAITSCLFANANRDPKRNSGFKVEDFLVVKPKKPKQSPGEIMNILNSFAKRSKAK